MEQFVSQDPRSYSLYFDVKIWFRARNVTGTFEKRAPGRVVAIMAPPERGTFFRLQEYEKVGISLNDGKGRRICSMF